MRTQHTRHTRRAMRLGTRAISTARSRKRWALLVLAPVLAPLVEEVAAEAEAEEEEEDPPLDLASLSRSFTACSRMRARSMVVVSPRARLAQRASAGASGGVVVGRALSSGT